MMMIAATRVATMLDYEDHRHVSYHHGPRACATAPLVAAIPDDDCQRAYRDNYHHCAAYVPSSV